MLEVTSLTVGPLQSNCHIVKNTQTDEILIVDPGDEPAEILKTVNALGGKVVAIWNTHGHFDHINGNAMVREKTLAPLSIHEIEEEWLQNSVLNLGAMMPELPFYPSTADRTFKGGEIVNILGADWEIHHVPGHSPGMSAFVCREANIMISGDLLFRDSIGRTDFPNCSREAMENSLRGLFTDWGHDDWKVYSGHGPVTTIARERKHNMFVKMVLQGQGL